MRWYDPYTRSSSPGPGSDDPEPQQRVYSTREAVASEMRFAEDAAATARRIEVAQTVLLYPHDLNDDNISVAPSDWPIRESRLEGDWVGYHDWPTTVAQPEELRAAYARYGAVFKAHESGELTMHLELDLGHSETMEEKEEGVANGSQGHGNELWEFDENGLMKRRDASINDYKIDESERKFR